MVLINESMMCLKAGMTVMILRTRMILKSRATNTLELAPIGTKLKTTMMVSKIFQPSL